MTTANRFVAGEVEITHKNPDPPSRRRARLRTDDVTGEFAVDGPPPVNEDIDGGDESDMTPDELDELVERTLRERSDTSEFRFDPNQPRHPAGSSEGGRFAPADGVRAGQNPSGYEAQTDEGVAMSGLTFRTDAGEFTIDVNEEFTNDRRSGVRGEIVDADGNVAGKFGRVFYPNAEPPHVYNGYFQIDEARRGEGIGTAFLDATEDVYYSLGYREAQLRAVSDGKYAWAARGYDFASLAEAEQVAVDLAVYANENGATMEAARFREVGDRYAEISGRGEPLSPYDLLAVDRDLAKQGMLTASSWLGTRELKPRSAQFASTFAATGHD